MFTESTTNPSRFVFASKHGDLAFRVGRRSFDDPVRIWVSGTLTLHRVEHDIRFDSDLDAIGDTIRPGVSLSQPRANSWDRTSSHAADELASEVVSFAMSAFLSAGYDLPGLADTGYATDMLMREDPENRDGLWRRTPDTREAHKVVTGLVDYLRDQDTVARLRAGIPPREARREADFTRSLLREHLSNLLDCAYASPQDLWTVIAEHSEVGFVEGRTVEAAREAAGRLFPGRKVTVRRAD